MENAPSYLPVYTDPGLAPDVDPDSVRAYLLSGNCLPLALVAVEPTPGQIRLVRPVPLPDDPQHAVSLQRILDNIRVLRQNLVIAGDSKALLMQEANFTFLTCLLMKERGFGAIANWWWWRRMFASRTVVALAEFLYERHGDVRLRTDLATAECSAPGFLDSGLTVFASMLPRPARRSHVAPERGFDSGTSLASTARCTSA